MHLSEILNSKTGVTIPRPTKFCYSISNRILNLCINLRNKKVNTEMEKMGKKPQWSNVKYYFRVFRKGMRKTVKAVTYDSRGFVEDSKQVPPNASHSPSAW
jgi:hypothetical protein